MKTSGCRFRGIDSNILASVAVVGSLLLSACGGGDSDGGGSDRPPPGYTVGGSVSGLNGSVVLQNNGGDDRTVSAAGSFTFATPVTGGTYSVTVRTQPTDQTCAVSAGSGAVTAHVTSVQIVCTTNPLTLASSTPANDATGVEPDVQPALVFSTILAASTVTPSTVTLSSDDGDEAVELVVSGTQITMRPQRPLWFATNYMVRASTEVKGNLGGLLASSAQTGFTTRDGLWRAPVLIKSDNLVAASNPQIAVDSSGRAIAVWEQLDGAQYSIWSNRYTVGSGWGAPEIISTSTGGSARYPKVSVNASGNALAVWHQYDGVRVSNIWANRFTAGDGWETPELIETDDAGSAIDPQIATDANGHALAVWSQIDGAGARADIWSNRYTAGSGWGVAQLIETDTAGGSAGSPQVEVDALGNAIAVWHQQVLQPSGGVYRRVWSNRYTAGGDWGTAEIIDTAVADALRPQVAMGPNGIAFAVWEQFEGARYTAWSSRYAVDSGWGTPVRISPNGANVRNPKIAIDENGHALAVWEGGSASYSIWSNRYTVGGGWGDAQRIQAEGSGNALNPQIAVDARGHAIAVWEQTDGIRNSVWSNRFTAANGWAAPALIETSDLGEALGTQIAIGSDGHAVAVWEQSDGTSASVWVNRFD